MCKVFPNTHPLENRTMNKQFAILKNNAIIFILHVRENQAPATKHRVRAGVIYGINLDSPTLRVNNYLVDNTKDVVEINDVVKKLKPFKDYNFENTKHQPGHITAKRYKAIINAILDIKAPAPVKKERKEKTV